MNNRNIRVKIETLNRLKSIRNELDLRSMDALINRTLNVFVNDYYYRKMTGKPIQDKRVQQRREIKKKIYTDIEKMAKDDGNPINLLETLKEIQEFSATH